MLCCWLFVSCSKPWYCGEVKGIENSSILIYPFDQATNKYIYSDIENRSLYNRDSLQVLDEEGKKYPFVSFLANQDPRNSLERIYALKISPVFRIPADNDAFEKEKTRKIHLKYNYHVSDTLTVVFKAYKDKCDKGVYQYFKVFHRNKVIYSINDGIDVDFTLNH